MQPAMSRMPGAGDIRRRWSLRRNCSVSPRQFVAGTAAMMAPAAVVALAGACSGLWMITGYCLAETLLILGAAVCCARHMRDGEELLLLGDGRLLVEVHDGESVVRHEFESSRARVVLHDEDCAGPSVWLHAGRHRLRLARHVAPPRAAAFEVDFRRSLLA